MAKDQLKGNHKEIDRSNIPPAARRAAEEADRLQAQLNNPEPNPELTPQPAAPTNPEPAPQPAAPTNPEPAPQPQPAAGHEDPNDDSWRAKFESEQGRLRKVRQDLEAASRTVTDLRNVIATMHAAPPAPSEMSFERPKLVTDAEVAEWTPELINIIERKAQEIAQPQIDALKSQIEQLGGTVSHVQDNIGQTSRQSMISLLDASPQTVGDWRALNEHPDFIAWLQNVDSMSGQVRHELLKEAWTRNEASRVAAFFTSYLTEKGQAPQPNPTPAPAPAPAPAAKPTLESLAAPGPSRNAPSQGSAEPEIITRADIARFYADQAAGRFRGKEGEAKAYEAQIFKATAEGRVQ